MPGRCTTPKLLDKNCHPDPAERSEAGEGPPSSCTHVGRTSCRLNAKLQAKSSICGGET